jgi:UDP-N-acetylmuramate: L-alanyl-gamma-D-glutamyl-meso-diaminopimelate ligase
MKKIHFIAIGGAIMHQLAIALHKKGYIITGSDDAITDPAASNLRNENMLPEATGWFPEKLTADIDAVVLGMHAKESNPELKAALQLNIPVFSFPEYIYEYCKNKIRVVVAGSHGKTTITSMIMHILKKEGMDFDYLVGAKVPGFDSSVRLSDAPLVILEGDEYPASVIEKRPKIMFYHPNITVLSGIAWDHINVFPTYDFYFEQFNNYLKSLSPDTTLVYNETDLEVLRALSQIAPSTKVVPYTKPKYTYRAGIPHMETPFGTIPVSVFGSHNLLNMQAAIKVCVELGVPLQHCYNNIADFVGAGLRLQKMAETPSIVLFRDFAHAPSKLKATLAGVREAYPEHTIIACFELHTYSSLTENFLKEYAHSMDEATAAIVFYSQHALVLKGLPLVNPEFIGKCFERQDLKVTDSKELLQQAVAIALKAATQPAVLLLMSSGTFDGLNWDFVTAS